MQCERLRCRGDHGHTDPYIGLRAEAKRAQREHLPIGLAKNLKTRMRQRVGNDADLDTHRLLFDHTQKVFKLLAGEGTPRATNALGQIVATDQA